MYIYMHSHIHMYIYTYSGVQGKSKSPIFLKIHVGMHRVVVNLRVSQS